MSVRRGAVVESLRHHPSARKPRGARRNSGLGVQQRGDCARHVQIRGGRAIDIGAPEVGAGRGAEVVHFKLTQSAVGAVSRRGFGAGVGV